jgi:hypothetical protein
MCAQAKADLRVRCGGLPACRMMRLVSVLLSGLCLISLVAGQRTPAPTPTIPPTPFNTPAITSPTPGPTPVPEGVPTPAPTPFGTRPTFAPTSLVGDEPSAIPTMAPLTTFPTPVPSLAVFPITAPPEVLMGESTTGGAVESPGSAAGGSAPAPAPTLAGVSEAGQKIVEDGSKAAKDGADKVKATISPAPRSASVGMYTVAIAMAVPLLMARALR